MSHSERQRQHVYKSKRLKGCMVTPSRDLFTEDFFSTFKRCLHQCLTDLTLDYFNKLDISHLLSSTSHIMLPPEPSQWLFFNIFNVMSDVRAEELFQCGVGGFSSICFGSHVGLVAISEGFSSPVMWKCSNPMQNSDVNILQIDKVSVCLKPEEPGGCHCV